MLTEPSNLRQEKKVQNAKRIVGRVHLAPDKPAQAPTVSVARFLNMIFIFFLQLPSDKSAFQKKTLLKYRKLLIITLVL